jgi:YidC/Oxa1 family membrane protein insertase
MDPINLLAIVKPAISIPIWDQYVHFLVAVLDGLATFFANAGLAIIASNAAGLAIIAFTIIVKTLMLPLTVQAIRSSKSMQELAPRIKELQKKHGNDRQRLSQETMALYQQHRVNPMAGCLPMIIQIPIFLGLYNAIMTLSTSGAGPWTEPFLWLPSLALPDPIHILPIVAAAFQFVQTQMMRPAHQPKSTDPQQAMMNSIMNIMPLTVIFFGWTFAAGPVLYWATQSVYSVIQQWFITGWGRLIEWAPWLPEMPEHRRLGYRPPRDIDDVVVVSGNGEPVYAPGPMGWFQRKMNEAQKQAMERTGMQASGASGSSESQSAAAETATSVVARTGNGAARGRGAAGRNGRGKKSGKGAGAAASRGAEVDNGAAAASVPAGAVIVPRKAKPAPESQSASRPDGKPSS